MHRKGKWQGGRPCITYQSAAAEQNHEDDEGLKPVVLNNLEAGPAQCPPHFPTALGDVHIEAGAALHTGWEAGWEHVTGLWMFQNAPPHSLPCLPQDWGPTSSPQLAPSGSHSRGSGTLYSPDITAAKTKMLREEAQDVCSPHGPPSQQA